MAQSPGGVEILLRFEALRLRAVLRILRDYPVSAAIGALVAVGASAGLRLRLTQATEIDAHPGLAGAMIGVLAGWAATTGTIGRWLPAVSEGPLAHVVSGGRTAEAVAIIRVLFVCLLVFGLTLFLLLGEVGGLRTSGGYLAGVIFGSAFSVGLSRLWSSVKPSGLNPGATDRRAARSLPTRGLAILVHLRRPGRSWGAGLSALALALTGIAAGQLGPRDGVEVGQFAWYAAQVACGLIVFAPHTSLLRALATRPTPLPDLYSNLMLGRIGLQFGAALFSAAFVFSGPLDILAWAIAATVVPAMISTIQFFYGLMYEKTIADIRLCLDLGLLAFMAVLVGPFMFAALLPWLWYLYVKTDRMRWGRM